PCFDLLPNDHTWLEQQETFLRIPESYPTSGFTDSSKKVQSTLPPNSSVFYGQYQQGANTSHQLLCTDEDMPQTIGLVAITPLAAGQLMTLTENKKLAVHGTHNRGGRWILVDHIKYIDQT
nr:FAD-dependent oxidoreductase [Leptolyngbyaceae cyanobacterium MAG.088]